MAAERVRRWAVRPDTTVAVRCDACGGDGQVPTADDPVACYQCHGVGQVAIACVSRSAMQEAIIDGEAFLARSGGVLTVVVGRQPTDIPGEAVTTNAVVEWKPGPRATLSSDGEQATSALPASPPEPPPAAYDAEAARAADAPTEPLPSPLPAGEHRDDGLDVEELEEEDLSAVPEPLR